MMIGLGVSLTLRVVEGNKYERGWYCGEGSGEDVMRRRSLGGCD